MENNIIKKVDTTKDLELAEKVKAVKEFGDVSKTIIENNTKIDERLFDLLGKEMDENKSSEEFNRLAQQTMNDHSKKLDSATEEESMKILENEMEIVRIASKKEEERIKNNKEIRESGIETNRESKELNWNILKACGLILIGAVGGVALGTAGKDLAAKLIDKK